MKSKLSFKRYFCCILIMGLTVTLAVLSACKYQAQQNPLELEEPPDINDIPRTGQWINLTDEQIEMMKLEGGSEIEGREPHPISNNVLQLKYPDVLALRGSLTVKKVALTFDDGPDPRYTPQILDVLKKYNAKATFFLIGARAAAHRSITERIVKEGHAVGNHTYWHPNLTKEGVKRLEWEVKETENVLNEILGYRPSLFRSPYGSLDEELVEKLNEMGYSAIGWSVDSLDWMQLSPEQIEKNVLSNIHPGAIILMHDGGHWTMDLLGTVQSLDRIIPALQRDGVEFVTVPELINISDGR
ncbi:polysaccharide deacetylase family protein [Acetivibrio saccincola]|uniref:Peptidoglycan-N-acetylglucosamine deacetylase n=3 Tax=Acetivibrio saccincola TaxID=1677857 RepID=A0A2K9EG36_9FIRM|nr:polysaccharide deacetylase family protein [Acetivibrio saccincola]AUG59104.1 Peptidoglycan-N-acetylglucosamine deacetylase [Acetivibrio saccincola]NLW28030.1 polysaccharide deacetylase family protein [Acetivibrio saccincola]HOA97039.1 polysaccharide deacetylase family protein [Acetivibrio saccincola]